MAWIYLVIAGVLEIGWATSMKFTDGFSRLWPSVGTILLMIISFALLSQAIRTIPVGTGYAIWAGIGTAGTAIFGMIFFNEPATLVRGACILMIVLGIIGLKLAGDPQ